MYAHRCQRRLDVPQPRSARLDLEADGCLLIQINAAAASMRKLSLVGSGCRVP